MYICQHLLQESGIPLDTDGCLDYSAVFANLSDAAVEPVAMHKVAYLHMRSTLAEYMLAPETPELAMCEPPRGAYDWGNLDRPLMNEAIRANSEGEIDLDLEEYEGEPEYLDWGDHYAEGVDNIEQ